MPRTDSSNPINKQLEQLTRLWIDTSPESIGCIPALCAAIEEWASRCDSGTGIDGDLVRRASILSTTAGRRLAECVAIQTRTGSYSRSGSPELSSRVATSGWEA